MRRAAFSFALLFLVAQCIAVYYVPPLDDVSESNRGAAESLMHFGSNLGGVPENEMSYSHPVAFFDVQVLCAVPEVGGMVSGENENEILWAWGEEHIEYVKEYTGGGCGGQRSYREKWSAGEPEIQEFKAYVEFAGEEREMELCNGGCENPFPSMFSSEEISSAEERIDNETHEMVPNYLKAGVYGKVKFPYKAKIVTYREECHSTPEGGEVCSCERDVDGPFDASEILEGESEREFEVEKGDAVPFLFYPYMLEAETNQSVMFLHSNREVQRFYPLIDGEVSGAVYRFVYEIEEDGYGVERIEVEEVDIREIQEGDGNITEVFEPNSDIHYNVSGVCSETECYPLEINGSRKNYSEFYVFQTVYGTAGEKRMGFVFYDRFGKEIFLERNISYKKPTTLNVYGEMRGLNSVEVSAILYGGGKPLDGRMVNLSVEGQWAVASTGSDGKVSRVFDVESSNSYSIGAEFEGDEVYSEASSGNILFSIGTGRFIDWEKFGVALILLGFFSGVLLAGRGSVMGASILNPSSGAIAGILNFSAGKVLMDNLKKPRTSMRFGVSVGISKEPKGAKGGGGNSPSSQGPKTKKAPSQKKTKSKTKKVMNARALREKRSAWAVKKKSQGKGKAKKKANKRGKKTPQYTHGQIAMLSQLKALNMKYYRDLDKKENLNKIVPEIHKEYQKIFKKNHPRVKNLKPPKVILLKQKDFAKFSIFTDTGKIVTSGNEYKLALKTPAFYKNDTIVFNKDVVDAGKLIGFPLPSHKHMVAVHEVGHHFGSFGNVPNTLKIDEGMNQKISEKIATRTMGKETRTEWKQFGGVFDMYGKRKYMVTKMEGLVGEIAIREDFMDNGLNRTAKILEQRTGDKKALRSILRDAEKTSDTGSSKKFDKRIAHYNKLIKKRLK